MRKRIRTTAAMLSMLLLLGACSAGTPGTAGSGEYNVPDYGDGLRYQPEWTRDAVIYEINVQQYTPEGTFTAFAEHLQQLKDMGINTLWFMPIHPISKTLRFGTLGSYYSATDYREVNPEFGTAEDFKALVDQAHEMGFKVMLDWVANRTGWDSPWITEHPDWYTQDESGNIVSPPGMGWPDVADLNFDNADMRAEMIACMKYWVEEYDIDGYRCDHAAGVPLVYTGDEIGLDHFIAFMEKDTVDWDSTGVSYRELLAELARIRSGNKALFSGNYGGAIEYADMGNIEVLAFTRQKDENTVTCLFNLTKRESTVNLTGLFTGCDTVLLHGQGADILEMDDQPLAGAGLDGEVTLRPWEFWIVSGGSAE